MSHLLGEYSTRDSSSMQSSTAYGNSYANSAPAQQGGLKQTLFGTPLRQMISVSVFWGVILIIIVSIVYAAGKNSSQSSLSTNPNVQTTVPVVQYSGDFMSYLGSPDTVARAVPRNLTIGFVADTALTEDTQSLYKLMLSEGCELVVISGDLDYINNPPGWDSLISTTLGPNYPVIAASGNHDYAIWPQYQKLLIERWQRAGISQCRGVPGVAHVCTWNGVTIVQITPGVFNETKGIYRNVPEIGGLDQVQFIKDSFAAYPSIWKICSWHKNQHQMQTGEKTDETGWGVYQECLRQGASVWTGHEHSYERSYQMTDFQKQTLSPGKIKNDLTISPTTGAVVVQGLGGRGIRPDLIPGQQHWAVYDNTNTSATFSGTVCKFNVNGVDQTRAYCYTKNIKNKIIDSFNLITKN